MQPKYEFTEEEIQAEMIRQREKQERKLKKHELKKQVKEKEKLKKKAKKGDEKKKKHKKEKKRKSEPVEEEEGRLREYDRWAKSFLSTSYQFFSLSSFRGHTTGNCRISLLLWVRYRYGTTFNVEPDNFQEPYFSLETDRFLCLNLL